MNDPSVNDPSVNDPSVNDPSVNVSQSPIETIVAKSQSFMIDSQQV